MDEDLVYDLYLLPRQVAEYHGIYDAWLILNGKVVILTALQFSKRHSAMMRQVSNRQVRIMCVQNIFCVCFRTYISFVAPSRLDYLDGRQRQK